MQPFNYAYDWDNSSDYMIIADPAISQMNSYQGSVTQMATSVVTNTNPLCYERNGGCASIYAFEVSLPTLDVPIALIWCQYRPGYDEGYITWVSDNKVAWTLRGGAVGADSRVEIGPRLIPNEPMVRVSADTLQVLNVL